MLLYLWYRGGKVGTAAFAYLSRFPWLDIRVIKPMRNWRIFRRHNLSISLKCIWKLIVSKTPVSIFKETSVKTLRGISVLVYGVSEIRRGRGMRLSDHVRSQRGRGHLLLRSSFSLVNEICLWFYFYLSGFYFYFIRTLTNGLCDLFTFRVRGYDSQSHKKKKKDKINVIALIPGISFTNRV